ncbi:MAG: PAS domain S-box protein, partial [Chloroflexota bacterium]
MPTPLKVLILEDSPNDILLLLRELRRSGFDVDHIAVSTADDMRRALQSRKWDIILSDYSMGGFDALNALAIVKELGIDIPFIITSGTVGEDTAVTAMKAGASDFFAKDKLTRLIPAVERELREAEGRRKRGEAEASFTTVFHASPIGILISRLSDGQVVDVNPRLLALYGLSRDDIMLMKGSELENWVKLKQPGQITQQLRDTGSARSVEVEYQHASGKQGYALLSAEIIELNNETCMLSMVQDITDRKEAETALRTSEEKFRLLAENSTDMIARLTPSGHFLYVSPASRTLLGYEPEELIGHSIYALFFPDDVETITNAYQEILGGQETNTVAYRIRAKDGRYVWFETISRTIRDLESDEILEIQVASRDISERKAAEQSMELYAERLELLHSIDLAILSADQPQAIAEAVLTRLQSSMDFDSASITSFDLPKNQFMRLAAIAPIPNFYPFDDQSIIELLRGDAIYYLDDLGNVAPQSPSERALINAGICSYVRIPLISSGKLLGAFSLCAKKPKAFLLNELEIAKEVGSQLAIVIENARLLEVAQRRNSELAALHRASLQLTSSLDIEKILDTVVDYAISLIDA